MLVPVHHTDRRVEGQPASVVGDTWPTEVVPRLPAALVAQARPLKAFQRVRGVATPADLLRAVLAYVLGALSTRRLGAWAVLSGLADISEVAWRKRLRASNAWLLWLLRELIAAPGLPRTPGTSATLLPPPRPTAAHGDNAAPTTRRAGHRTLGLSRAWKPQRRRSGGWKASAAGRG